MSAQARGLCLSPSTLLAYGSPSSLLGDTMKEIGIGLLGFGTVGAGVVDGLLRHGELLADRVGARPVVRRIADLDLDGDRGVEVDPAVMTQDAESVVNAGDVDVVVELIGGTGAARSLMMRALELGKPVVTANKALLAACGKEIFGLARERGTDIYFGASVGGGIPIIRAVREGLIANHIVSMDGILNGTCNYILTRMEQDRLPFDKALKEAQDRGFAEADPGLDIEGKDTAHKATILASLAYGLYVPLEAVHVEGVRSITDLDIVYARDLGYRIKLLAVIKRVDDEVDVRVHPTLVPVGHMLASVVGVFNAVMVHGDLTGDTLYYGRGAGRNPTASTVIADIMDVIRNSMSGCAQRVPPVPISRKPVRLRAISDIETRCYLRLSLLDRPGVFARIASVLGAHEISIASVLQKEVRSGEYVPVVIVTHAARESRYVAALQEIDKLDVVGAETVRLRIEDYHESV